MSNPSYVNEIDAITMAMQNYIEGARTGKSAAMKPAFHEGATIFGYDGEELFGGPIQGLYDWHDQNGPARDIQARLSAIDVVGDCAHVRVDIDNWTGHRFTDFLNLVKVDGHWKIVSKVYHMHP
jgi:hypothetical protein